MCVWSAQAQALRSNATLRVLYLHHNRIGDHGCAAIADTLADANGNRTLTFLDLHHNHIGAPARLSRMLYAFSFFPFSIPALPVTLSVCA